MKYLLDTNVLSEAIKNRPNPHVMMRLDRHQNDVATAAPVYHELWYGCRRLPVSRKREIIASYIEDVIRQYIEILPYEARAAQWHAQERARLESQGRRVPHVDGQIAAIAQVNGLILVTRNTSDFERFENLRVENWHLP